MHLLAELMKSMPDWELDEEDECLYSHYPGNGWHAEITLSEFPRGSGIRLVIQSSVMFPQNALPDIGHFFLFAHCTVMFKYGLLGPERALTSQMPLMMDDETDCSYVSLLVEHARSVGVEEMGIVIEFLQKIAYGGLTVERAVELMETAGIPQ